MLSPTPFSLICALLLCLPFAVIFTVITPVTRTTIHNGVTTQIKINNPQITKNTTTTPKKIAFMFLTTIVPLPFAPLWEMYFHQAPTKLYNIYIHSDPNLPTTNFTGVFSNRVIPGTEPTRRYSPTLTSAARRLLSHALLHDKGNYMFTLISPSWAARGEQAMVPEVPYKEFRIGSQFFAMTRKHALVTVKDTRVWSKFRLPCVNKYTCYPEEHYFATLMSMVDPRGCVHATLTYVDWKGRQDGHPRMYLKEEVGPELILALRKQRPRYGDEDEIRINGSDSSVRKRKRHPFLWARKFSLDSVQPLMDIASEVIFRD